MPSFALLHIKATPALDRCVPSADPLLVTSSQLVRDNVKTSEEALLNAGHAANSENATHVVFFNQAVVVFAFCSACCCRLFRSVSVVRRRLAEVQS